MMMETRESSVPPGFRFHPTDEELVGYYLRKKVASQKIDLDVIRDIDLYRIEPWDLQEKCRIGYEEQKEWYFFSHKDKKYPTGTRTNRATIAGFWKATGRDKAVYDKSKLIGMRKTLVFYKGRAPNGLKSDWIIHEYRLESEHNGRPQEEGWVVCRAFKKRPTSGHAKNREAWDSSYFYDEPCVVSSALDPIDYITRHQQHQNFQPHNLLCKQELLLPSETLNNIFTNPDPTFLQLPQLDSPSLSLPKTQSSKSLVSFNAAVGGTEDEDEEEEVNVLKGNGNKNVTDWRDLDKFVAYQLSQGDDAVSSSFDHVEHREDDDNDDSDLGYLLLHNDREDFLRSNADCDIGICVFDK